MIHIAGFETFFEATLDKNRVAPHGVNWSFIKTINVVIASLFYSILTDKNLFTKNHLKSKVVSKNDVVTNAHWPVIETIDAGNYFIIFGINNWSIIKIIINLSQKALFRFKSNTIIFLSVKKVIERWIYSSSIIRELLQRSYEMSNS